MSFTLEQKRKLTIRVFGTDLPRFKDCPKCGSELSCEFRQYGYESACSSCQLKEAKEEEKRLKKLGIKKPVYNFGVSTMKDATAIGIDTTTGQPVALDTKGNKIPLEKTVYKSVDNLRNDPHGWKTMGKKVKEYKKGKRVK